MDLNFRAKNELVENIEFWIKKLNFATVCTNMSVRKQRDVNSKSSSPFFE